MRPMHVAFVVHVVQGTDLDGLLTEETKRDTQAVVMSLEDAAKMGFATSGVQVQPGHEAALIVVAQRDAARISRTLEGIGAVSGFQQVDVNIG